MMDNRSLKITLAVGLVFILALCLYAFTYPNLEHSVSLQVRASAYTSRPEETDDDPNIAAWGDELAPGMKVIAVSRDLLKLGLKRNTKVYIDGLGEFIVMDKMNKRWRRRIDIYMGNDLDAAREWGKRQVTIRW